MQIETCDTTGTELASDYPESHYAFDWGQRHITILALGMELTRTD